MTDSPFAKSYHTGNLKNPNGSLNEISSISIYLKVLDTDKYAVKIATKDLYTDQGLRECGVYTTGNSHFDAVMHNQPVYVFKTINELFELYRKNIGFVISPSDQTEHMYANISNYLNAAKQHLSGTLNASALDLDTLLALDAFASVIYEHATVHISNEWVESNLSKQFNPFGLMLQSKANDKDSKLDWKHTSLATDFVNSSKNNKLLGGK